MRPDVPGPGPRHLDTNDAGLTPHGRGRAPDDGARWALSRWATPSGTTRGGGAVQCEIHVKGRLSPEMSGAFEEFAISEPPAQTIVVGEIADNADLARLVAHAQSLGLTVLSLRALPE